MKKTKILSVMLAGTMLAGMTVGLTACGKEVTDGVKIDTLVAGIESGKRSFKIRRAKPDGKSYARDIAEKYGLTYGEILSKIEKNK